MFEADFLNDRIRRVWRDQRARSEALLSGSSAVRSLWGDRASTYFGMAHLTAMVCELSETEAGQEFLLRLHTRHTTISKARGLEAADVRVIAEIITLFLFDRRLRLLMWDGVKSFETVLRARLSDELHATIGRSWLSEQKVFDASRLSEHQSTCSMKKPSWKPINEVLEKKRKSLNLPIELSAEQTWRLLSNLYFSDLKTIFNTAEDGVRTRIASYWQCKPITLMSWLDSLHVLRNMLAHHKHVVTARPRGGAFAPDARHTGTKYENRFYSDSFQPPKIPAKKDREAVRALYGPETQKTVYALIVILCYSRKLHFSVPTLRRDVSQLLERYPVYWTLLGVPENGLDHPVFNPGRTHLEPD